MRAEAESQQESYERTIKETVKTLGPVLLKHRYDGKNQRTILCHLISSACSIVLNVTLKEVMDMGERLKKEVGS